VDYNRSFNDNLEYIDVQEKCHKLCFHRETNVVSEKCGRRYFSSFYRSPFARRFGVFDLFHEGERRANRNVTFSSLSRRFSRRQAMLKRCITSGKDKRCCFHLRMVPLRRTLAVVLHPYHLAMRLKDLTFERLPFRLVKRIFLVVTQYLLS